MEAPNLSQHCDYILERRGPLTDPSFQPGQPVKHFLRDQAAVLVIGAGGLGCEILQNLALLGFSNVHLIDMDTIDVSNLNRQFLFREKDIGQSKARVAAQFVTQRIPSCKVTPHHCKIQEKDDAFYKSFNLIISGLDSIEARRWINSTLVNLVDPEDPESLKPLIDGGTEGFKGQARVILPTITSCYECSLDMLTPQTSFPICTIANTPRLPEHCIEWASVLEWPRVFKDVRLDTDNPDHIQWLFDQADKRAKENSIQGVTWALTQGVVKNIIPAIASTNAIIAASCCNEAFKIATTCAPFLQNYMMYTGNDSIYTYTFEHQKKPDCQVCGTESIELRLSKSKLLSELIDHLLDLPNLHIKQPSLSRAEDQRPLYFQNPAQLNELTKPNLSKSLEELLSPPTSSAAAGGSEGGNSHRSGNILGMEVEEKGGGTVGGGNAEVANVVVTDSSLPFSLNVRILLT